jgi:circadian clock protein KaiC
MNDWPKTPTGISGFDAIAHGGLPRGRSTVVAGTPGSGKTLFALQFLASGIRDFGEPGVCVTFEESPEDLIRNVDSFGWGLQRLVDDGRLAFVDCSPDIDQPRDEIGAYDLPALLARIESAVSGVKATRLAADAIVTLLGRFRDTAAVRSELHRIHEGLRRMGVTSLITMERMDEDANLGRLGVEEFVADNVLLLRNRLEQERRRRTIEILKFRGTNHRKGEHPFTIDPDDGVTVIPVPVLEPSAEPRASTRVSSGVAQLDEMCGGGLFSDSIVLVSGATGTGKTLLATHQREVREHVIDSRGMHVRDPFRSVHGIITGTPSYVVGDEKARLDDMFDA